MPALKGTMSKPIAIEYIRLPHAIDAIGGRARQTFRVGSEGITGITMSEFGMARIEREGGEPIYTLVSGGAFAVAASPVVERKAEGSGSK